MMNATTLRVVAVVFVVALMLVGCAGEKVSISTNGDSTNSPTTNAANDHSGWWCVEHGIPEEECSMCSAKVATDCKEKGDWCEEHNRAKSQCFKCDPSLAEKYTNLYEAKYGKQPPAATD